ncbi:hypothetical protein LAWI1_G002306 [Lachnellula willkommii]|uniref:Uncharacterized protein n=1 Tax=Lachnellula willkommii TaxID=215461 RepID=A0A559MII1_9HELO|nr:hypothetical protein LAWI1_G002306 [Lachnellula willkommii]
MPPNGRSSNGGGLAAQTGWIGSVARFWEDVQKTYAPDYVGFVLLLAAYFLVQFLIEPFHRLFFLSNINIQYPHAEVERVPVGWNIFYAGGIPLVTLILTLAVTRSSIHKCHVTLLGFFIRWVLENAL